MKLRLMSYGLVVTLTMILIILFAFSSANAAASQLEYSSSVAQLVIEVEKEDAPKNYLRGQRGNESRIILVRIERGELDLSNCTPEKVFCGPYGKYTIVFSTVEEAQQALTLFKLQQNVIYAEMDAPVISCSNTIYEHTDYSFHSWAAEKMGFPEILDMSSIEASGGILIAIIDSGVAEHKQIRPRIAKLGFDYVDNDLDPTNDGTGHGTHVAGIIVDCTPNLSVNVMPIRVLNDSGGGRIANAVNAIDEAVAAGCSIINLSLVSPNTSDAFDDAVNRAISSGVTVVVAAGNNGSDVSNFSPVHLHTNGLIVVGAVDSSGSVASYSNYGSSVDLFAYGTGISSCAVSGSYVTKTGTSMAAPHITAACAILQLLHQCSGPSACESRLKSIADDTVCPIPVLSALVPTDVGITGLHLTLRVGTHIVLQNEAKPLQSRIALRWSSSANEVMTVEDNVLIAKTPGNAVLSVQCSKWVFSCDVSILGNNQSTGVLILPSALVEIGDESFMGNDGIRIADIKSSTLAIGDYAFANCNNLETAFIPASVVSIGINAFPLTTTVVLKPNSFSHEWALLCDQPYIIDTGQ